MSSKTVTIVTCNRCAAELRIPSEDPLYVAGWSDGQGWSEIRGRDYCPQCAVKFDGDAFDELFADIIAEAASPSRSTSA